MPSYARGEQKVCFYFLHLNISTFVLESNHLNNVANKKQRIVLTAASKHFSHVTFYAADMETGSIR